MQRENPLDPLVINYTSYRESLVYPPAFSADYRAGKYLRPGFIAFLDPAVHVHRIAHLKVRDLFLQALALNGIQ